MPPEGPVADWRDALRDLARDGHLQLPRDLVRLRLRLGFTAEEWWVAEAVINEMTAPPQTSPDYPRLMELTGYTQVSLRRILGSLFSKGLARPTGRYHNRAPIPDFEPLIMALVGIRNRSKMSGYPAGPQDANRSEMSACRSEMSGYESQPLRNERLPLKNERLGCETRLLPVGPEAPPETGDILETGDSTLGTERGADGNGHRNRSPQGSGPYGGFRTLGELQRHRQRELEEEIGD